MSTTSTRPPGKTTVATSVLLTIAGLTTLKVEGVSRMCPLPGGVNRLFQKGDYRDGVHIKIEDDRVFADLYVVLQHDVNIRDMSRNIQQAVQRAFSEMVGMEVGRINVHIENIDYPFLEEGIAEELDIE
ncbi:MAG: Asp23/Gls24 family envelope stress response protein [Chloroflexi bacterium]|jgi:uncharacterized alkaline shock family protein YloU|nr:Asp23/Gls24 family envelope stress response protein [Chloroflexota bacterium]